MATREEIREGVDSIIKQALDKGKTPEQITDLIFAYQHLQGVVIKVDRGTPYSEYADGVFNSKKKSQTKECLEKNGIYEKAQIDMLKAGYVAVEPLIANE